MEGLNKSDGIDSVVAFVLNDDSGSHGKEKANDGSDELAYVVAVIFAIDDCAFVEESHKGIAAASRSSLGRRSMF